MRISDLICGQVAGFRRALIYDDEIATGGSVRELSRLLVKGGVEEIIVICTHGVFTRGALDAPGRHPTGHRNRDH